MYLSPYLLFNNKVHFKSGAKVQLFLKTTNFLIRNFII
nr:MAG TPA: hypothetical protein [Caudoviricetes sp.]